MSAGLSFENGSSLIQLELSELFAPFPVQSRLDATFELPIADSLNLWIAGAGEAGETLARDLLRDPDRGFVPVGYVDDDSAKKGREIHGIRVLGDCEKIPPLTRRCSTGWCPGAGATRPGRRRRAGTASSST